MEDNQSFPLGKRKNKNTHKTIETFKTKLLKIIESYWYNGLLNALACCSKSSCVDEFVVLTGWIKLMIKTKLIIMIDLENLQQSLVIANSFNCKPRQQNDKCNASQITVLISYHYYH